LRYPRGEDTCPEERVGSGVSELDAMLGGGLPSGTTTMISGPSGSGKTSFGLHFMAQSNERERGVYLSLYETRERAYEKAARMGLRLRELPDGTVQFLWRPTTEHVLDILAHELLEAVSQPNVRRVFIDGFDAFRFAVTEPDRVIRFFTAMANELRSRGITSLYTYETQEFARATLEAPPRGVSAILENWVALRIASVEPELKRSITIAKVRDSAFMPTTREFAITDRGIVLGALIRVAPASGTPGAIP
jgi:circadian clock protein KaiC